MSKSLISAMNKHINALDELLKRIQDPRNGIAIEDRKYHLRVYPQTFVGRELVDWLVTNQIFASRGDAVAFGKVLVERGVIRHCTQGHDFKDEYLFYVIMPSFQLLSLLQKETEKLLSEKRVSIYDPSNVRIGAKKSESGKARCFKIQELIDTEKTYLRSLDVAIREYKTIMMSRNDIITEAKIKQIFANIEEVIMTCHGFLRELYKSIPDEFSETTCIGQIFLAYAPNWTTYATYAHKHQDAIALMLELEHKNDPVVNLLMSIRDEKDVLDVMSLLIQPVQRVPRYILLLDDLLKRTPDGHPDKEPLMKAIKGVESVAVDINESIREYEMLKHVDKVLKQYGYPKELDDVHLEGSKVLAEGWLAKVTRRGPTVRRFVVIKIPKAPNGGAIYYARASLQSLPTRASTQFTLTGVRRLPVGPYFAQPIPPTQDVQFAFKLLGKGKSFICIATSEDEQKMWIQAFNHLSNTEAQTSFAPVWIGDDHSNSCLRCNKQFTAVFRRHHCRNCGILVCHKCSSKKSVVKSVHPTNPTRVCDNCYDILEGALAAAGQVTGRALGSLIFFDNNDDTEDNDDESEFERLHLSNEDLRENLMKSAAVMIQRMALTLSQQPKTSNTTSDSSSTSGSSINDEERRVIIGAKSMSTDSETTSERSNSESTQNSSGNSSNRSSAELKSPGVARTRSSHVFGPNLARMTLLTPTTDDEENSTSDTKNRSWISSGSDPNPLNRRPTGFLLSRGRSTGEAPQNSEAPSTTDSV